MVEAPANVLIAWPKDCQAVVLITMINGFNLLSKSNVLSLCCQNLAPMSTPSPLPLPPHVPTHLLAAFPLVVRLPLRLGICLPITVPVCFPLGVKGGAFLSASTAESREATASWRSRPSQPSKPPLHRAESPYFPLYHSHVVFNPANAIIHGSLFQGRILAVEHEYP